MDDSSLSERCDPLDADQTRLRHARERSVGFAVGQYLQPAPILFTRDGHNVFLGDMYRGRPAFLICAGPSLKTHDLSKLQAPGILTLAVNNAAVVHRPQLWCSVDDPGNFCDLIWRDPAILKFVPLCHMEKRFTVRDAENQLIPSTECVGDMPAVFGFRRNETFVAERWLHEDTINWGNHSDQVDHYGNKGSRSVMYVALRLLYYLGVRQVYLLGCDFRMEHGRQNYAFEQERSRSSVRGNNGSYRILNVRLAALRPFFEKEGFEVFNCTPESGLTAFPHVPYEDAVARCRSGMPETAITVGMYDRQKSGRDLVRIGSPCSADATPAPRPLEKPGSAPAIPDFTTVVALARRTVKFLRQTWPTWMRHKPDVLRRPLRLLSEAQFSSGELPDELESHFDVRCVSFSAAEESGRNVDQQPEWGTVAERLAAAVETPWLLLLDPTAVAMGQPEWIQGRWFAPDDRGQSPVLVGSRWGYLKPWDVLRRLDAWGDGVAGLQERPRLDVPADPQSDRVRVSTIDTWCLFVEKEWLRESAELMKGCPAESLRTALFYCALRQGRSVVRVPLKDFGWEHSHGGGERQIQAFLHRTISLDGATVAASPSGEGE